MRKPLFCLQVIVIVLAGITQAQQTATNFAAMLAAAERGDSVAQLHVANAYFWGEYYGEEVPRDYATWASWVAKAAKQNLPTAQVELGNAYRQGLGVEKDLDKALMWYRRAANTGDMNGQLSLGLCYKDGVGVAIDYSLARHWLNLAARQGSLNAQLNLAEMSRIGLGTEVNLEEAITWFKEAARQEGPHAPAFLCGIYSDAEGGKFDVAEAKVWCGKAEESESDDYNGMTDYYLGQAELASVNGPPNLSSARDWFAQAAEKGLATGQYRYALMLAEGQGGNKDLVEALKWVLLASNRKLEQASQYSVELSKRLSEKQVQQAQKLAAQWIDAHPMEATQGTEGKEIVVEPILKRVKVD